jgi:hypothetical protein
LTLGEKSTAYPNSVGPSVQLDVFVNDYDEIVDGKKTAWRDSFTFMPGSHILVAAMNTDHEAWKTFITTTATRR